jgi:hypothetical protein
MQESLTPEHGRELVSNTLEELLNGGGVSNEGGGHLQSTGRNGAESGLHVVGDPLNEVGRVLVLDVAHLVLNLLHGDLSTEDGRAGQVTSVTEVRGGHHVLGVIHLLGELGNGDSTERVGSTGGEGSESDHEEMETGEGNHVDGELAEVRVKLTGETQTGGDTGHDGGDKVVQVSVGGGGKLEGTHANVVQGLVVDTEGLVGVLNELVNGEGGVVRLNNGVGNLGGGNDGEGGHHSVGELLTDLGDQKSTHTGTSTSSERVGDLETLEAVASLGLTTDDVQDLVDELGSLSVMSLGPVVTGSGLSENEVVGTEELSERTGTDGVHGTGLQVDKDGTGHVLVTGGLVEVDVHTLQLEVGGSVVAVTVSIPANAALRNSVYLHTGAIESVLTGNGLPEGGTNLVTL